MSIRRRANAPPCLSRGCVPRIRSALARRIHVYTCVSDLQHTSAVPSIQTVAYACIRGEARGSMTLAKRSDNAPCRVHQSNQGLSRSLAECAQPRHGHELRQLVRPSIYPATPRGARVRNFEAEQYDGMNEVKHLRKWSVGGYRRDIGQPFCNSQPPPQDRASSTEEANRAF